MGQPQHLFQAVGVYSIGSCCPKCAHSWQFLPSIVVGSFSCRLELKSCDACYFDMILVMNQGFGPHPRAKLRLFLLLRSHFTSDLRTELRVHLSDRVDADRSYPEARIVDH